MVYCPSVANASCHPRITKSDTAHRSSHDRWCRQSTEGWKGEDRICFWCNYPPCLESDKNTHTIIIVRKYVEALKDSSQLLDLLSVAGSNDIDPTTAAAGRTALYPDVCANFVSAIAVSYSQRPSISPRRLHLQVSKLESCTKGISTLINTII